MKWSRYLWLLTMSSFISACSLPALKPRSESYAFSQDEVIDTRLAQGITQLTQKHPQQSGFYPIADSLDAFAVRMLMVQAADKSLDVQYYIWRNDLTGTLLLNSLHEAAERGVRVRLLLDDHGTKGLDNILALMNQHPNIDIRLFNPFPNRTFKLLRFVGDFSLANRRMHNKSFTADNSIAVVGGRNIGDEYFGATDGILFNDLDVVTIGPIVEDTSGDFDRYWNSPLAYPFEQIVHKKVASNSDLLSNALKKALANQTSQHYLDALIRSQLVEQLMNADQVMRWADIDLVSDNPNNLNAPRLYKDSMLYQLVQTAGNPKQRFDLVSPYFVPGKENTQSLIDMKKSGVDIRILTNSREATDVKAVHAGYKKYRQPLLEAGIELYEMMKLPDLDGKKEKAGLFGSSGSSLHAKTFVTDNKRVFIGSFNFDPRSARLNTEMGYIIHSSELAYDIQNGLSQLMPQRTYKVQLEEGQLSWQAPSGTLHTREPGKHFWGDVWIWMLSALPESQL